MHAGRAGAISMGIKSKNKRKAQNKEENEDFFSVKPISPADIGLEEQIDTLKQVLQLRRYPFTLWMMSILVFICASILLGIVASRSWNSVFKDGQNSKWWQYFLVAILFILSLAFTYVAKIETIIMNKPEQMLIIQKRNLFCIRGETRYLFSSIQNIGIIRSGRKTFHEDSIHYKLLVRLKHEGTIRILETNNREEARKRLQVIRNFLSDAVEFPSQSEYIDEAVRV